MLLAMGSLSNLFNYLLSQHHIPTMFFFGGLIIGIVPYLLKISNYKTLIYKETLHDGYIWYRYLNCLLH